MPFSRASRITSLGLTSVLLVGDIVSDPSSTRTASDSSIAMGLLPRRVAFFAAATEWTPRAPRHYKKQTRALASRGLWTPRPTIVGACLCVLHKPRGYRVDQLGTAGLISASWERASALSLK